MCMLGPVFNFIFYSVLKKKYNFEINVLLYGIGFTSCCFVFIYSVMGLYGPITGNIELVMRFLYVIPFIFLYYSYATLLKNNEKSISRGTLFLIIATTALFVLFALFEIITYRIPYVSISSIPFGLYFVYCLISGKYVLSLRGFAWVPFLPAYAVLFYTFMKIPFM
ncbi:hypothetical protein [Methanimicrococcus hacksteinii]|uniref:hypothetical protein n=1 Tax=Methanimicrococcus hacksteinii TaxID=3028293 RepID=UPI00298EF273|nr:hypothetical protein [Methanimicrococcus sp. At1]